MFRSYLRLLLFTFGLLAGIQVPGLVKDYSQRVEAHLFESRQALDGFKQTAERFFKGDLQALVRHYRSSDDVVFNSDANSIESLLIRNQVLENEWQALQGSWVSRTWHVLVQPDPQMREETLKGYSYQILLVPEAIGWGVGAGFVLAFVVESLLLGIAWVILGGRRKAVKESWR
ncbi:MULTISPECIES: DUF2937 family protein [Pseudomonas]|jgi:hypothetical protein|uniref:DUF2937 family protein n=1 Tax=Pseudomonas TaxID=286 RepID=UPI000F7A4014|nr:MULTISPECIES: DUF2937 family protein [Pseudomonas]MBG6126753.1 hypothetical protein [Pseudomonas sp. M2]NSX22251.1 DUF2937 family protein [Pseudomonas putida]RRV39913.1 DUF2937 family protein [Pseudomonas sp. p106]GLH32472.1 hypothetical protein BR1R5_18590 [Pseudomonas sp. BR1R-5]HDS1746653.1 DUF2937 family protein [Pseudomonas putida]